jgi:hypothetical protein
MIGQIQICFFKKTPVREIERPTLEVAQVMWGERARFPLTDRRNQLEIFIVACSIRILGMRDAEPGPV